MVDEAPIDDEEHGEKAFDFDSHARVATAEFEHVRPTFQDFARDLRDVISDALAAKDIKASSVDARAKTLESFRLKASLQSESDPNKPKYAKPLEEITDLAGVRVIVFFPKELSHVEAVVAEQLDILERSDKGEALLEEERFGYQSIHYLVRMKTNRTDLPEYTRYQGKVAEV